MITDLSRPIHNFHFLLQYQDFDPWLLLEHLLWSLHETPPLCYDDMLDSFEAWLYWDCTTLDTCFLIIFYLYKTTLGKTILTNCYSLLYLKTHCLCWILIAGNGVKIQDWETKKAYGCDNYCFDISKWYSLWFSIQTRNFES